MTKQPEKSSEPPDLLTLLRAIKKRPGMYIPVPGGPITIWHIKSFVVGFQVGSFGKGEHQEGDLILDAFTFWVCTYFEINMGPMDWSGHIWRQCGEDPEVAFHKFFELLEEYIKKREEIGPEAIKAQFMEMTDRIRVKN
jgi:hypothetical protein